MFLIIYKHLKLTFFGEKICRKFQVSRNDQEHLLSQTKLSLKKNSYFWSTLTPVRKWGNIEKSGSPLSLFMKTNKVHQITHDMGKQCS